MRTEALCARCGVQMAASAAGPLCPACLARSDLDETVATPHPSDDPPPASLAKAPRRFGNYELLEEIARGGMGLVFKARQRALNREVAIKMVAGGSLASADAVRRFRTEAEAAANLQHPNIVAIHEVGEQEGQHYFSMDYVRGRNLAEAFQEVRCAPREAARLVSILAEAVQYAHQRGILHRDLKPQNVLLDERQQPRLTDFGLAKHARSQGDLTVSGALLGTPSYMSPEQAAGRLADIGPGTDVYGLGAILYFLLTGQPPIAGENPSATIAKVVAEEPAPPRRLDAGIPAELETVCLKCLEKQPLRRYATAGALAEDLSRFLSGEPVLARPVSIARKLRAGLFRRPWLVVAFLSAIVVFALWAVFWLRTENAFLRFLAENPGYKPARTVPFAWLQPAILFYLTGFAWIAGGDLLVRAGFWAVRRLAWVSRAAADRGRKRLSLISGSVVSGLSAVTGVRLIRVGVEGHFWSGDPYLPPLLIGALLLFVALFTAAECLEPWRRGPLPGSVRSAALSLGSGPGMRRLLPNAKLSFARSSVILAAAAAAYYFGRRGEYGNQILTAFLFAALLWVALRGIYLDHKSGFTTKRRAISFALLNLSGVLFPYLALGSHLADVSLRVCLTVGGQALLGALLGALASAALFPAPFPLRIAPAPTDG